MIAPTRLYLFRWVKGARSMNIPGFARQRLQQVDNSLRLERQDDHHIRSRDCDIISFQFVTGSRKKFLVELTLQKQETVAIRSTYLLFLNLVISLYKICSFF